MPDIATNIAGALTVSFELTEADYIAWARDQAYDGDGVEVRRKEVRRQHLRYLAAAAAAGVIGLLSLTGLVPPAIAAIPLLGFALVIGHKSLHAVCILTVAERERTLVDWAQSDETQRYLLGRYTIEATGDHFIINGPHSRAEHDWLRVLEAKQTPHYIFIELDHDGNIVIPRPAFATDAQRCAFLRTVRHRIAEAHGLEGSPIAGVCDCCGYDLNGLTERRCPECGVTF